MEDSALSIINRRRQRGDYRANFHKLFAVFSSGFRVII